MINQAGRWPLPRLNSFCYKKKAMQALRLSSACALWLPPSGTHRLCLLAILRTKEGRQDSTRDGQLMKHTLLSWAAPASRDFCHRASGGSGTGRKCPAGARDPRGSVQSSSARCAHWNHPPRPKHRVHAARGRAEEPQALKSPRAGCSISNKLSPWHAATSMCSPTIQGCFRHSDAGTTHGVAHNAGPSYRKFADLLCD